MKKWFVRTGSGADGFNTAPAAGSEKAVLRCMSWPNRYEFFLRCATIPERIGAALFAEKSIMMNETQGIIDTERNPFGCQSGIEQGYGLTDPRKGELAPLFGKTVDEIMSNDDPNASRYPAFVGVRWGFAVIDGGRLAQTEKWVNRKQHSDKGEPL